MRSRSILFFALLLTAISTAFAQPRNTRPQIRNSDRYEQDLRAHERGYRTGYEDGFAQGKDDFNRDQPRDFTRSQDYQRADRGYERQMGRVEEYQDGYRIGFEMGYNDGYFGRPFSVSVPQNLTTVVVGTGTVATREQPREQPEGRESPRDDRRSTTTRPTGNNRPPSQSANDDLFIPEGDQLRIRLTSPLNTKTNREGDQFTARVVSPSAYVNATVVGHIARITHSGKATGKTEMLLAFDEITMPDGQSAPFEAQVEKVYDGATVKTVDEEGNVQTGSRTKDTATRGAGGAALGAIIGGIAGGGKGAAIGAVLGGAAGAGSVYVQSGKDIIFEPGTEMMIRSLGNPRK
ncbi:MAG: hypothetical protein JST84_14115 [Acidobacteria bacterium]|nr:hypothetical protein [Acidobacteriota bacterium]